MLEITRGIKLNVNGQTGVVTTKTINGKLTQVPVKLWLTYQANSVPASGMMVNVRDIKAILIQQITHQNPVCPKTVDLLRWAHNMMSDKFSNCKLIRLKLDVTETMSMTIKTEDDNMMQLTVKYELAAAHRLWNDQWDHEKNRQVFGKCANAAGHGHNYLLEITLQGIADPDTGLLIKRQTLDQIVTKEIIEKFDHKNLNADCKAFEKLIPTVENMAKVFWDKLIGKFQNAKLNQIRLWETTETYADYKEN